METAVTDDTMFVIGEPLVSKAPSPKVNQVPRILFNDAAWRSWNHIVDRAPGEVSVMAEVETIESDSEFTLLVSKLHMVKQYNNSSYTEMDELALNKLNAQLSLDNRVDFLFGWIHSHAYYKVFVSGVDQNNCDRWFAEGGKRLLMIITNKRGDVFGRYMWKEKDDNGVEVVRAVDLPIFHENPFMGMLAEWEKVMAEVCFKSNGDEMGFDKSEPVRRHRSLDDAFDEEQEDDETISRQIARIHRRDRFNRERMTPRVQRHNNFDIEDPKMAMDLSSEIASKVQELKRLNEDLEPVGFGTERYDEITMRIWEVEQDLNTLRSKQMEAMFGQGGNS